MFERVFPRGPPRVSLNRVRDSQAVFARNVQSECVRVSESERACQMTVTCKDKGPKSDVMNLKDFNDF